MGIGVGSLVRWRKGATGGDLGVVVDLSEGARQVRVRFDNDPATELAEATEQQRQITRLRLEKLVRPVAPLARTGG